MLEQSLCIHRSNLSLTIPVGWFQVTINLQRRMVLKFVNSVSGKCRSPFSSLFLEFLFVILTFHPVVICDVDLTNQKITCDLNGSIFIKVSASRTVEGS